MNECLTAILECPYWNLVSFFLAIFAALISVGYLLKPRMIYSIYNRTKADKTKWVVEVRNKNRLPLKIKEIKCEIAISDTVDFTVAKSLKLLKNETLFLNRDTNKYSSNYIFVPENDTEKCIENNENKVYYFIRVKLLVTNILSVRKHYERICRIECLTNDVCESLKGNCEHKRLTKKLIKEERKKQNNHA
jgi:hypothetical protein